jgi:hypothetical protein
MKKSAPSKKSIPLWDPEPPSADDASHDRLARALMAGDEAAAAKALRELDELHNPLLEVLADLFDGDPVYGGLYPYRLKLVPRRRGRPPVDELTKQALEQTIARAVHYALPKFAKLEAAVAHVQHELLKGKKLSRATIFKYYNAHRSKFSKNQSP